MSHVKQKPPVGAASTATMARLRDAVANSAKRRSSKRGETTDEVREPPAHIDDNEDHVSHMPAAPRSEPEQDEGADRLSELRRMARRLADNSKHGDLRRSRSVADEAPIEHPVAPRLTRPPVSRSTTRTARTVEPVQTDEYLEAADPVDADGTAPTLDDGASTRDRLSRTAPPAGYEHDAAEVLAAKTPKRSWPLIALSVVIALGAVGTAATMLLGLEQTSPEPTRRGEVPSAQVEVASKPQPAQAEPFSAKEPQWNSTPPVANDTAAPDASPAPEASAVPATPAAPAANPLPSPPPQVVSQQGKIAAAAPAPLTSVRLTPPEVRQVQSLMASGRSRAGAGDVAGARAVYQRAADIGDGPAALALAETYDPAVLARPGVSGIKADLATARHWYQVAVDRGVAEARTRLERMSAR